MELKEQFDNYEVEIVKHLDCTDEEIGYHIRRYNKQKSMNASENAVTFMDNVAKEVKRISLNNKFFKNDIYKETERNNGTVERIVTESVMCMFHLESWQKQSKKMGDFLNRNSSGKEFDRLNENLKRLENIYDDCFKNVFTAKDSFIWFTLFDKFTKLGLPDEKFIEFVKEFNSGLSGKEINGDTFRDIDKNRSTKDKSVIVRKLFILETLMNEFLHITSKEDKSVKKENREGVASVTAKDIVTEFINSAADDGDMELYEIIANDISESIDDPDAAILSDKNRSSFVALAAYAAQEEEEDTLKEWIRNSHVFIRLTGKEKEDYLQMREMFDTYRKNSGSE